MDTFGLARSKLVLKNQFFGTLALYLQPEPDKKIGTAATDGRVLKYNEEWLEEVKQKYGLEAVITIIAHEVLHCALGHVWRRGTREPLLWNIACDCAANLILRESGFKLPQGALVNEAYSGKTAEDIYALLQKNGISKGGTTIILLDNHDLWGNAHPGGNGDTGDKDAAKDIIAGSGTAKGDIAGTLENEWKNRLVSVASALKSQGKLPASLERIVEEIAQPQIPYRYVLAEYMQRIENEYAWGPFDRRFVHAGEYLPSTNSEGFDEIVVAIDTSGSISDVEIKQFIGEVMSIASIGANTLHVVFCDAKVQGWYTMSAQDEVPPFKIKGGGGTDFRPVFDAVAEKGMQPAVLIYLSDGYGDYPEKEPEYPVLWVMTRNHQNPPFGRVVTLDV
ncbi:vWA domain-containing protein [Fervidicola ferrireducens]|nr:VWA-like domain-containing protein [Fervidicola ferrireducens]